jgi:hypothetical protein
LTGFFNGAKIIIEIQNNQKQGGSVMGKKEPFSVKQWIKAFLFFVFYCIKDFFIEIKRSIWNRGLKLGWYRLWVRKDEFHPSLNMDSKAMFGMSKEARKRYMFDLIRRRQIAHERDLASSK